MLVGQHIQRGNTPSRKETLSFRGPGSSVLLRPTWDAPPGPWGRHRLTKGPAAWLMDGQKVVGVGGGGGEGVGGGGGRCPAQWVCPSETQNPWQGKRSLPLGPQSKFVHFTGQRWLSSPLPEPVSQGRSQCHRGRVEGILAQTIAGHPGLQVFQAEELRFLCSPWAIASLGL